MTNFTLTEALLWLWDTDDAEEARAAVDHVTDLVNRATERNIPHPFI